MSHNQYFEVNPQGVFCTPIKDNVPQAPIRLSDCIEIIGRGLDEYKNHYRVIQWTDPITHQKEKAVLSMGEIGTSASWLNLQSKGIAILSGKRKRELLSDYLQTECDGAPEFIVCNKAGWNADKSAYILPNGDIISKNHSIQQAIYNGDTSQSHAYTVSGSLNEWKEQIGKYMSDNSRLCLAIGTALAAPLLYLTGEQNGGFHIYGDSSDGKTTVAKVGLSVWGNPQILALSWRGTDLGFSNAALTRNDNFLVLDEIGEANAQTISKTAYSVINGKSKIQANKDGGNRPQSEWRILLFSTGEYALNSYIEKNGGTWEAGQAVRLPSIPASTVHGVFENLHGFKNGAELSNHLQDVVERQYGTVGRAWLSILHSTSTQRIREIQAEFLARLPDELHQGQVGRVAKRFSLVATALEMSRSITGIQQGMGMLMVQKCFDDWLNRTGAGKQEDLKIIKKMADFMQLNADNGRFAQWDAKTTSPHHAGYFREVDYGRSTQYWIVPAVFEQEIFQGIDVQKACQVLCDLGWLIRAEQDRWKHKKRDKGRFYVLNGLEVPEK